MFRRVLSLILSLCVLMTSMPTWSIAAALAENDEVIVEVIAAEPEEEEEEEEPTPEPTKAPTPEPTKEPTPEPTKEPTPEPTEEPKPVAEEPVVKAEEPAAEEPEEPKAEEPVVEEPVVEEPVVEEPVVEEPVVEEPVVEEPVVEEPVIEEPVVEEPVVEETEEIEEPVFEDVFFTEPRFVDGYAYVAADEEVYADDELTDVLGAFAEKTVVYVSDREETADEDQDVLTLRFACEDELVKAYIAAKNVKPLSDEQTADYEDEAADGVHYKDDVYLLSVEFVYDEEETESPEATEEPVKPEEPVVEEPEEDEKPAKDKKPVIVDAVIAPDADEEESEDSDKPETEILEKPVATENAKKTEIVGQITIKATCAHENKKYTGDMYEVVEGTELTCDAHTHTGTFNVTTFYDCLDCGEKLRPEEVVTGTFDHQYVDMVCYICGYEAQCTHNPEPKETNTYWTDDAVDNGDGTHTVSISKCMTAYCSICDVVVSEEEIEGKKPVTEPHSFYGENTCWVCGAKNPCTHPANKVVNHDRVYYNLVWGEITDTHHTLTADIYKLSYCQACEATFEETMLEQNVTVTEPHEYYGGVCWCGKVADFMAAPYINPESMSQPGDKQVTFSWSGAAENYKVYEVLAEGDKAVATVSANTVTLKNVALGEHTYYVKPYDAATGAEGDASNYVIWRVDSVAWKKAPVIKTAKQAADVEGVVELVWTHGERAEYYVVYDGESAVAATTDLSVTLENVAPGKHSYTVQPMQHDYRGNEIAGTKSKAKAVTVAEMWNKKPTLSSAKQDTSGMGEGLVLLTFKPGKGALTHAYAILDKFGNETYLVGIVESDEATVTYMVEGAEAGSHVYSVAPVLVDENGVVYDENDMPVMGLVSGTKTVKVAALWNKKPTLSVAKQLDDEEGHVQLTWKSGSALTQAWQIFDKYNGSTIPMSVVVASEPTVTYDIYGLPAGSHVFSVKPVEVDENGVVYDDDGMPVVGVASGTKTVKVAEFWVKAPTITAVTQSGSNISDEVAAKAKVEWTAGSELTQAFAVYGTFNKVKNLLAVVVGQTSAEVELSGVGSWSFTVAPVKLDENGEYDLDDLKLGTASKAKTLKVTAATWADAPILKAVQKVDNAEGEVLLSWTQIVEADGFKIYEVINKKNVPVDGDETEPTVQAGAMEYVLEGVEAGKHTYVVKPMRYDADEGWTFLTTAGVSSKASAAANVTVAEQWSMKPVINEAVQDEYSTNNTVYLEWMPGSPLTEAFEVLDNNKVVMVTNMSSVTLENVAVGSHKYTVKPIKFNDDGRTYTTGTASAAKTVKVTALWDAKPTIKSAVQLTDAEGTVKLTFSTTAKIIEEFEILNKFAGETIEVYPDSMTYDLDAGVMVAVISGLEKGSNSFTVVPKHYNYVTGEVEYGAASSAKSVSIKELWSLKPTGLKAEQIMSSAELTEEEYPYVPFTDPVEDKQSFVRLTWNAGSNPNMTGDFAIFVGGVQVADEDVVYAKYVDIGSNGLNTAIIANQKAAANKYTVKPMNGDEQGIASAAVTAKVVELWKIAPEIKTVRQYSATEVEIVWTAGSELQDLFVIYDTFGGKTTEVWRTEALSKDADYEYSAVLSGVADGSHKYTVKAYTLNAAGEAVEGGASNAVILDVTDANWAAEPWITDIYQDAIGQVTIEWDHVTKAESYIVYELIGTAFVPFDAVSEMSITVPVNATGTHTYAVRPQMADPENEGKMLTGAMSKTVSVYLYAASDAKLTGFTVVQNGFNAELSWNAHDLAIDYAVTMTDVKAGGSVTAKTGGATKYTFTVPKAGVYDFEVAPVFGDDNNGQAVAKRGVEFGEAVELTAVFDPAKDGVVLTWTASTASSVRGYNIYRDPSKDDEEVGMGHIAGGSSFLTNRTYVDTSVELGKEYTYAVSAYRAGGEDVLSAPKTVTPHLPEIAPATGLTGRHLGQGIELSWTASADADKYDIYYEVWEETGYGIEHVLTTTETEADIYLDEPNTAHTYYILACAEWEHYIQIAESETITVNPVEAAQISAKFNPETGNVELSWNAVEGNPEYYLEKKAGSADWQPVGNGKMEGTSYTDTDVALGNTYGYRMITKHAAGYAVSETSIQLKQLGRVTGFDVWFLNEWVELMWDDMVTVSGYEIQRSDDDGATYNTIATITEEEYLTKVEQMGGFTAYTDKVPSLNAKYLYRVRGLIGDKAGAWSSVGVANIGDRPVVKEVYYSHKFGGVVLEWEKYEGAWGYNIMRDGRSIIDEPIPADVTRFIDSNVEQGVTYRYDVDVLVDGGEISCEDTFEVTPDVLPKVGVADTFYFNETTEITLVLPDNAASEYTYVVKENGELLDSEVVVEDDEWKIVFDAADLNDHTYTVHVGVVMDNGTVMTGEGTEVTIDRGEFWKLKNITDDEYGVHLYWDTQSTMPKKLFVMSYDVTDEKNHINRGGMDADPASGEYVDAEVAGSGKKLDYWLEAIYEDGVLSSELLSDCEELLPYTVKSTFFAYEVNADKKTATITGYNGTKLDNMVIPETVDGYTVTKIGNGEQFATPNAEGGLTGTLTLPETVVELGEQVFYEAAITGEIKFPASLKVIGSRAFASSSISGELVIPATVEKVEFGAFNAIEKVNSVVIEGANTEFEAGVFRACYDGATHTGLESITLPEGMTTIPFLFAESTRTLKTVNIPSTVTMIDGAAFSNTGLTGKLVLPSGLITLGKGAFGHTDYTEAEIYHKNLSEEMIADAFDYHWDGRADDCVPSTELKLTKIYGYFGSGAYHYAVAKGIEFVGIGVTDEGVRYDVLADGTAVVMGTETVSGDVVIPATVDGIKVTQIGKDAFKGKTAITSVTVPDGVTEICESAFEGCTGMTSATLPDSVEIIGVRAFANCTSLSSMTAK